MELKYIIDIQYHNGAYETFEVTTSNIEFTMDQYQRNRDPFIWKIRTNIEA
jgi:hypothetical protein